MPANNGKWQVHYWQGLYGNLGHLYSPGNAKGPYAHLPYALDNGAFPAFVNKVPWSERSWLSLLQWAANQEQKPLWALVPDVVANREETIKRWAQYEPVVRSLLPGIPLGFAVQDGMTHSDVPSAAEIVFVGGGTQWKWATVRYWCNLFPRVHVGRVNGIRGLEICASAGAESCDGTGWFRGDMNQLRGLELFLAKQAHKVSQQATSVPRSVVQLHTRRKAGSSIITGPLTAY
jgi:hypothetical protein